MAEISVCHVYLNFLLTLNDGIHFHVVLYKQGPEFHHASYSVVVRDLNMSNENNNSWIQLATINRITESVSKVVYTENLNFVPHTVLFIKNAF